MKLNELISKFDYISNHPKEMMEDYIKDGKKVIGVMPVYTPEEIVHAAGMVPMLSLIHI